MNTKLKSVCAAIAMAFCTGHAVAAGTLIPATAPQDMVYDAQRKLIYVTDATQVLRYDVTTGKFLSPITLGGNLYGIDLSPDGTTLAVGDATSTTVNSTTNLVIHQVSLPSLVDTPALFPLSTQLFGSGTWAVAYGGNGDLMASVSLDGSGYTAMLEYTASKKTWSVLSPFMQSSMLATSGNGRIIAFVEPNNSGGPFGFLNDVSNKLNEYQLGGFIYEVATNVSGDQIALIGGGSVDVYTNGTGGYAFPGIGGVYDPVRPVAYFTQPNSTNVIAYNMNNLTKRTVYDLNTTFAHPGVFGFGNGRTRISLDGSLLMAVGNDGVHYLQLYAPLAVAPVAATTTSGNAVALTAAGSLGIAGTLTYELPGKPAHGTATVNGNVVTYVPDSGFVGTDTFGYRVLYERAFANGTMSVTVTAAASALGLADATMTLHTRSPVLVPVLVNARGADNQSLHIVAVKQPAHGRATIQGEQILYAPPDQRDSSETLEYTVSDGHGRMATGHTTVRVTNAN